YTTNNTYVYSNGDTPGDDVPGGNGDIPSIALQQFNALPGHDDTGGKQPVAIGNKPETGIPGKSHPSIWVGGSADNGKGEDEEEDDDDEYVTPTFRNPVRPTSEPDEVQRPAEKPKPSWSQPEEEKPAYSPPQRNNPEPRPEPARPSAPKPTTSATKKGGR
ncbi:MAG: hypothetical protein JNM00_08705, partial [Flavobacteriales bacterium]|nr:hypothetical protein [Flavobacteriales bacterium]